MVKWMLYIYNTDMLCLLDRCLSNGWPWNVFITGSLLIRVTFGVTVSFKFSFWGICRGQNHYDPNIFCISGSANTIYSFSDFH